jgi:hypothetical protein
MKEHHRLSGIGRLLQERRLSVNFTDSPFLTSSILLIQFAG